MPQRRRSGVQEIKPDEPIERSLSARAEELRARRDRLMQLHLDTNDEEAEIHADTNDPAEPSPAEMLAVARLEVDHARRQTRIAHRVLWLAIGCTTVLIAAAACASFLVMHKLNRDSIEIERATAQLRAQRELSSLIAEERDTLRVDLLKAHVARARAEGQLSALTGVRAPTHAHTPDLGTP